MVTTHELVALSIVSLAIATGIAAGCGKDVSLGAGEGEIDASTSTGGGGSGFCDDKVCGLPCPIPDLEKFGWCDGNGTCIVDVYPCADDPCAEKKCGAECEPCNPAEGEGCPLPPREFTCNRFGQCVIGQSDCTACEPGDPYCYNPCIGVGCGTPCDPCVPGDECPPPSEPWVCDGYQSCLPISRAYCDPCVDPATGLPKLCGEPCDYCDAHPWDPTCEPSEFLYLCDFFGTCTPPEVMTHCPPDLMPCEDKACGEPCSVCDPMVASCVDVGKLVCNPDGQCSQFYSCTGYDPCAGKSCNDPCTPCDPNDPGCIPPPEPHSCDLFGACVPAPVSCWMPCLGQACGTGCQPCDLMMDPNCLPSSIPYFCDANQVCNIVENVKCPLGYEPCSGKTCGELCTVCDPNDPSCPEQGIFLGCTGDPGICWEIASCWHPCIGKECGDPCTICDPFDMGCIEPPPQMGKACDAAGACVDIPPACPP